MALNLNRLQTRVLRVTMADITSGSPVSIGDQIGGIALNDTQADGTVEVDIGFEASVYNLAVKGEDGDGNAAIAVGDALYKNSSVYNANPAGQFIGRALAAVASGATTTIPVIIGNAVAGK
jgi:predicted RecA/RadA family phage recombinase